MFPPFTTIAPTLIILGLRLAIMAAILINVILDILNLYQQSLTFNRGHDIVFFMENILNLAIGIPSLDMVHTDFMLSLLGTCMDIKSRPVPGFDGSKVSVINKRSSVIAQLREDIVADAKERKATHLLWIDSDQMFPTDTARRLLSHNKDVVACNIAIKRIPSLPTARRELRHYPLIGDLVYTKPESKGLEQVWKIGCGIMLENMDVYEKIPAPYFRFDYNPTTGSVGEDWWHCELLRKADIDIWIDHDLSKQVGHLGVYSHTMNDIDHTETNIKIIRPGDVCPPTT